MTECENVKKRYFSLKVTVVTAGKDMSELWNGKMKGNDLTEKKQAISVSNNVKKPFHSVKRLYFAP